jgi:asparagine synthase (glutamine-hydrolysing)
MCAIAGICHLRPTPVANLHASLEVMMRLQSHRGPDGGGVWVDAERGVGFGHQRLAIIDIDGGRQPMTDGHGRWITYNGEIYNYLELRDEIGRDAFRTTSDTEVILRAYDAWGLDAVRRLRGMFAFALWDERNQQLVCARDAFGIKPFVYARVGDALYFSSEAKALLPFLPSIATDHDALKDYLTFQFCLGGRTLFEGVSELRPGHMMTAASGDTRVVRYARVPDVADDGGDASDIEARLRDALRESVSLHVRSDVPVGAYVSGGVDSGIVASLASCARGDVMGFTGRFDAGPAYDESAYAAAVARHAGIDLATVTIGAEDFVAHIRDVIFHLDYPVAGPGAFPQYMVARRVAADRKVVLGGQGGDEIFGGYARYFIACFEQSLKAAVQGGAGDDAVAIESMVQNLGLLDGYAPLLQAFWKDGLFGPEDLRYFALVNRADGIGDLVDWDALGPHSPLEAFRALFNDEASGPTYFDRMTRFDFRTLLPALLHVEDRMSMAHGVESRVPLVDPAIVDLAAAIPARVKFAGGRLKHVLKAACTGDLPPAVLARTDKMGFPTPLVEICRGPARDFVHDVFASASARTRGFVRNDRVVGRLETEPRFGRTFWALLSLELWQQTFHDRSAWYKQLRPNMPRRPWEDVRVETRS